MGRRPSGNPTGKPPRLTPEVGERICNAVRDGNYLEAAAAAGGVTYTALRMWVVRGEREQSGRYVDFVKELNKAQAAAEIAVVSQWRANIPDNWPAARDFLARRFPERWGPKAHLTHSGAGGTPIEFTLNITRPGQQPDETDPNDDSNASDE